MESVSKDLLEERICELLEKLNSYETGTAEHKQTIDEIDRLYKLKIEEFRAEADWADKVDRHEQDKLNHEDEMEVKKMQIKADSKKRRLLPDGNTIVYCITLVGLTAVALVFEASDHIYPKTILRYADKIKIG